MQGWFNTDTACSICPRPAMCSMRCVQHMLASCCLQCMLACHMQHVGPVWDLQASLQARWYGCIGQIRLVCHFFDTPAIGIKCNTWVQSSKMKSDTFLLCIYIHSFKKLWQSRQNNGCVMKQTGLWKKKNNWHFGILPRNILENTTDSGALELYASDDLSLSEACC